MPLPRRHPVLAALSLAVGLAGLAQGAVAGTVTYDFSSSNGGFTPAGTTGSGHAFVYTGTQWTVNGVSSIAISTLAAPVVTALAGAVTLSFSHTYRFEDPTEAWDGGQLRVSVSGGADQVVGSGIGSFSQNGYNRTILSGSSSPIVGQQAWSGGPTTVTSIANLGTFAAGTTLAFKWLGAWDSATRASDPNWALTSVSIDGIETAVPLPATPTLVVLGLGALAARRRSRRAR